MIDFSNWLNSTNIQSSQFLKLHPAKHLTIIGMLFCGISTFCLFCKYLDRNNADGYWISEAFGFRFAISLPPYLSQLFPFFVYFQICIWFPLVCPICEREGKLDEQTLVKIYHLDSWCSQSHSHQVDLETLFLQQSLFCLFFFFRKLRWWSWWCCRCWRQIRLMNE